MMSIDRVRRPFHVTAPDEVIPRATALERVERALAEWQPASASEAARICETLMQAHPDHHAPEDFWHSAAAKAFRDFFVWGHNHDFGHGFTRSGAMGDRHKEITSELISLGMMPGDLKGQRVLDIGCWSGGDLLILAGLGAQVEAIEEHPLAAATARDLSQLLGCDAPIHSFSAYNDRPEWKQSFDLVYCCGVIYHVTDPLLLLRICFAYLKPGGRLVIETKMQEGEGSTCSYSGIVERGWNWYAPTFEAMGRWMVDAGFAEEHVRVHRRPIGRLLASGIKTGAIALPETAGFSRPGSWLESAI
jgi:2-polyprenyl-3-methyl-5-hydroxy-6-metoxy-1,4-benzoquinol methylase